MPNFSKDELAVDVIQFSPRPTPTIGRSNSPTSGALWYDSVTNSFQGIVNGAIQTVGIGPLSTIVAIKPTLPGDMVQFVSSNGNDANDGLSWGSAKLTVYAALQALPGGSASVAGSGSVWISGIVNYGGPVANQGMWLVGPNDPNFATPPTGWLKSSSPISIGCIAIARSEAHGHVNGCVMSGGGTTDSVHPAVWIAGTNQPITFDHVFFPDGLNTYIKYGIATNGDRTGTGGASGFSYNNGGWNFGNCRLGGGPGFDIGSNSFWIWGQDNTFSGCSAQIFTVAASGAVRLSNVTTITTTTVNNIATGDKLAIQNVTDSTFNGYPTVTVVDNQHFTYPNPGSNTTSGTGQVITESAAAIRIQPNEAGGGGGSGLIFFDNTNLNSGGILFSPGTNGGGLYVNKLSYEGDFTHPDMPPVLITGVKGSNSMTVRIDHVEVADALVSIPPVQVYNGLDSPPGSYKAVMVDGVDYSSGIPLFHLLPILFANLPVPASNSALFFCSDCAIGTPCTGSGTGALALRANGVWVCK